MTVFDVLLLGVIGISVAFAMARGAIRELTTLAVLGLAALVAWLGAKPALAFFGSNGVFQTILAAGLIGLLAFVGFYFIAHKALLRLKLNKKLKQADRLGGGAFGLARALALIGLGFLGYGYYLDEANQPDAVRDAMLRPLAAASASFFKQFAPSERDLQKQKTAAPAKPANAAKEGYANADRTGLKEIVATVTTTETTNRSRASDAIADILAEEPTANASPERN
ncbi:MAG: CvpA family protein [Parvularculaceae bacterium]